MKLLHSWLTGILFAAILCAGVDFLAEKLGKTGPVLKSVCGIFFILSVFSPLTSLDLEETLSAAFAQYSLDMTPVEEGKESHENSLREIISQRTCTYILERASQLDATLEVSVHISDGEPPVPDSVEIKGNLSPFAKASLEAYIEEQLGISKEAIHWMNQ